MKFNYEKLEKVQDTFNGLYDKCNLAMGTISRELSKILREMNDTSMKTYVRWEYGDHLKAVDDITITKSGLDFSDKGLYLHMFSDEFEDGELEFQVPYEWLDAEDEEMELLVKQWINKSVDDFIERKNFQIERGLEDKKGDLIKRIKEFDKGQVIELLKEIPELSDAIK